MSEANQFSFLDTSAREAGAIETGVIPAAGIIVENRGRFKCQSGCPYFGSSLVCPPHAPKPEEFRKVLDEYSQAMVVRFQTTATAQDETACSMLRLMTDPDIPECQREDLRQFYETFGADCRRFYLAMLSLEREAFRAGYPHAVALMPGPCLLCETCSGLNGACTHPTMRRFPADALGINLIRTAARAGMEIRFPFHGSPSSVGILLIT